MKQIEVVMDRHPISVLFEDRFLSHLCPEVPIHKSIVAVTRFDLITSNRVVVATHKFIGVALIEAKFNLAFILGQNFKSGAFCLHCSPLALVFVESMVLVKEFDNWSELRVEVQCRLFAQLGPEFYFVKAMGAVFNW
jgi:hypothetical protein